MLCCVCWGQLFFWFILMCVCVCAYYPGHAGQGKGRLAPRPFGSQGGRGIRPPGHFGSGKGECARLYPAPSVQLYSLVRGVFFSKQPAEEFFFWERVELVCLVVYCEAARGGPVAACMRHGCVLARSRMLLGAATRVSCAFSRAVMSLVRIQPTG